MVTFYLLDAISNFSLFIHQATEVIFNAYRFDNISLPGTITYSGANVNLRNGLDPSTGIFTAPTPGFYFFQFQALAANGKANFISIKHNGEMVSSTYRCGQNVSIVCNYLYVIVVLPHIQ